MCLVQLGSTEHFKLPLQVFLCKQGYFNGEHIYISEYTVFENNISVSRCWKVFPFKLILNYVKCLFSSPGMNGKPLQFRAKKARNESKSSCDCQSLRGMAFCSLFHHEGTKSNNSRVVFSVNPKVIKK